METKPCRKCGATERYASSGACAPCHRAAQAAWNAANPERKRMISTAHYAANREQIKVRGAARRAANPEKNRARAAAWRIANPERDRSTKRANMLARNYHITPGEWEQMFWIQGRKCKVCRCDEPSGYGWHVDHVHESGLIRGILCSSCNMGLGIAKDDPQLLRKMADYVETNGIGGTHESRTC